MHLSKELLREIYEKAFGIFKPGSPVPEISVAFYPYVNVNHTIRVREGSVLVKISTLFSDAPPAVHEALALILVAKLFRRKVPPKADIVYRDFVSDPDFRERAISHKRRKGRKLLTGPKGSSYDLQEIFDRLNNEYFGDSLPKPRLSWSGGKTFRRLGHYDEAHNAIVISRSLDSRLIPAFVVEYVVYHEMLHVKHPTFHRNGRRYSHTPEFKRDERRYDYFEEADGWIERNSSELKEIAGGKAKRKGRRNYWGLFD